MMDMYNSLPGYLRDKNIDIDQFMKIVGVNEEAIERYMNRTHRHYANLIPLIK